MQPEHIQVGDLFTRECTYVAPLFQRPYVWDDKRWVPLWEDVAGVAEEACDGAKARRHFLGSVVLQQMQTGITQGPRREVIDGQQRLTTLQLLVKAAADVLAADKETEDHARPLRRLLRNEDAPKVDAPAAFKVWPTNVDQDRFAAVMGGDGTVKAADGDRFAAGYTFFRKAIADWLNEDLVFRPARAQALAGTLRQRLWLIALNLGTDDQAQVIFETLNARGTPLLPADLVKNLLLRRAEAEGADVAALYAAYWKPFDADETYWRHEIGRGHAGRPRVDLFLVQFLTAKVLELVSPGQLYDRFAEYVARAGLTAADHMTEVARWAAVWRELDMAEEASSDRVLVCAARVRGLDFTTALPVLLHLRAKPGVDKVDAAQAALGIEGFLIRRMVCGGGTRNYGKLFVDVLKDVAAANSGTVARVVADRLHMPGDRDGWPDDARFATDFSSLALYRSLRRDRLNLLLRALETSLRTSPMHDPVPLPRTLHIEHVMPQNWRKHWELPSDAGSDAEVARDQACHTIGNLTLLTAKLNQTLSDSAWKIKVPELKRFTLTELSKQVIFQPDWNEGTIQVRGKHLADVALAIWPRPPSP